ncbi:acetylornithine transaminase [Streptomyces sp. QL37]|uniref:acetylornithine transaminase n=1 Tax=Streptomyces sp. QL37 TaxID=2093747 RepID=UPI000CF2BF96|nr:acetylornithine transaminase [Streptomyces sp. QL37]PPQ60220.1 acetylornithine transaminase [Streptomyces sp. QL37]
MRRAGKELTERWQASLMNNYGTPRVPLVRGEGVFLWDVDGNRYVDLVGGIAVNSLGTAHPAVVGAVCEQVGRLGHVSNLFVSEPAVELAERLLRMAGRPGRVFFANSGAEANEAAFKMGRLSGRTRVVAAEGGFHGRTMGALALTGQPAKRDPFQPLPGLVTHVPFGDVEALRAQVDADTAMVVLEPVQGENGVVVPPPGYLAAAREITRATGALLALDEVQTGVGRTGHWFAYQAQGIEPDVVTLGKGLGGGLPIGATLAFGAAADLLTPGTHGTTFGGNPVVCAAALAVLDAIDEGDLLGNVKRQGEYLRTGVEALGHPLIDEVRGAGLLLALTLTRPLAPQVEKTLEESGYLVNAIGPHVIRIAPPLIIDTAEITAFLRALPDALNSAVDR